MGESAGGVRVTTAEGVKEEIAELTAASPDDDQFRRAEIEKRDICAELPAWRGGDHALSLHAHAAGRA